MNKFEATVHIRGRADHIAVVNLYVLPNPGDKLRIMSDNILTVEWYLMVERCVHLCTTKGSHIIAIHCVES